MSVYDHNVIRLDKSKFNPIDEAYIGKTPILEEVEKKIHELRNSGLTMTNCSSTNKTVLEINRLIEKQFGMYIFAFKILPTITIDAYNYPICCRLDMGKEDFSKAVEGNLKSGYRFRQGNNFAVVVCMSLGLLTDMRFSDEAIMACILHEIGHNFGDCLDGDIRAYNKTLMKEFKTSLILDVVLNVICATSIIGIPFAVKGLIDDVNAANNNKNKYLKNEAKKDRKKKPGSGRLLAFLAGKKGEFKDRMDTRDIIASRTNQYYIDAINANKNNVSDEDKEAIKQSASRRSEVIADKFASIYGYGIGFAELMSIFSDITSSREYKLTRKIKPGHKKENDEFEKAMFDITDYDEHPNSIQRLNTVLKTLRSEYEKEDIDPRIKEELLYQINQIQSNVDNLSDASKKFYRIDKAQAMYFDYVKNNLPDAISAEIEASIDDELDKALEKQEKHYSKKRY